MYILYVTYEGRVKIIKYVLSTIYHSVYHINWTILLYFCLAIIDVLMKRMCKCFLMMPLLLIGLQAFAIDDTCALRKAADSLVSNKKNREAERIYTSLLNTDSSRADIYEKRGITLAALSEYQDAFNDLSRALVLQPDNAEYYHQRGGFLMSINMQEDAISDFSTAIIFATDPAKKRDYYADRSDARAYKRDFEGALSDISKVTEVDSLDVDAIVGISHILGEMKRDTEALRYLQIGLRHYPDNGRVLNNLALIYVDLGQYSNALDIDTRAVNLSEDPALPYNNRGYVKYKLNDLDGALADINKSLEIYPTNAYAYRNRALVYIARNKTDLACADLKEADKKGYKSMYGDEVDELTAKYCK